MEVPYEREEEEVVGMDLETRSTITRKIHQSKKQISPTSSDTSCLSSVSSTDTSFQYFSIVNTSISNGNSESTVTITNGEKHSLHEITSVVEEESSVEEKDETLPEVVNFEEPNVSENTGTNGFTVHQNGSSVPHSVSNSDAGVKAMDDASNGSSFSKSPNTGVGFKDVEGLLNARNENVVINPSDDSRPEEDEFDVESVIQKQETHDLYCPNCHSCITKRVILRRRKRKIKDISTSEEPSGSGPGQGVSAVSDDIAEESQPPPHDGGASGRRFDALSCFSCFSIFIPTSEGFLCWRFKPKPNVAQLSDGTPTKLGQAEDSQLDDTGKFFPLWIVTCCQPAEQKTSGDTAPTFGSNNQPTPEDEAFPHQREPPLPPSDGSPFDPSPVAAPPQKEGFQLGARPTSQKKPLAPIKPYGETLSSETPPPIKADEGDNFSMWFLTCCQPSVDGKKPDRSAKTDKTAPAGETPSRPSGSSKPPSAPFYGSESPAALFDDGTAPPGETPSRPSGVSEPPSAPFYGSESPAAPSDDNPVTPKPAPPPIYDPVPVASTPSKPNITTKPSVPLPPHSAARGSAVAPMPPASEPPFMPSDAHGAQPLLDVEHGLAHEPPRPRVSGLDIVKAIVYGGLLESITSLSVITSAAGGDATTLNIVALGLANVFGGLIVLVHNLRVLKREHTTEHYEAQLGRPGHYLLHAIVAIISYLVFGLMSPVIYGFSFRESDNKDYKLATLAGAALLSITVLSAAKAYVRDPPKAYIKTVFYYVSLGFMVSGLGYVAGDLINELLKKLGVFDSNAPATLSLLRAAEATGAWSSY